MRYYIIMRSRIVFALIFLLGMVSFSHAQRYTNEQQNFAVTLPGPAVVDTSDPDSFVVSGFNADYTAGGFVISPNAKTHAPDVGNEQAYWSNLVDGLKGKFTIVSCTYPYWNGASTVLCDITDTNSSGVHLTGKLWATVHMGYLYGVVGFVSDNSGKGLSTVPKEIVNSFAFIK
jgi:hypothetical protein